MSLTKRTTLGTKYLEVDAYNNLRTVLIRAPPRNVIFWGVVIVRLVVVVVVAVGAGGVVVVVVVVGAVVLESVWIYIFFGESVL